LPGCWEGHEFHSCRYAPENVSALQRLRESSAHSVTFLATSVAAASDLRKLYCTTCVIETELPVNPSAPPYAAVIAVDPTGKAAVETLAVPSFNATVPNVVVPAVNVTLPNGSTPVEDVTVAVKVTVCPDDEGFADEVRTVVVDAGFTTSSNTEDVLCKDSSSPLYSAVRLCVPTRTSVFVIVATPPTNGSDPIPVKVTRPVAPPGALDATVTV